MRTMLFDGRLAADAEVKVSKNNNQYLSFSLASQEYNEKEPTWINVISFNVADIKRVKWLTKGKPINVVGEVNFGEYVSKKDNSVKKSIDVMAYSISYQMSNKNDDSNSSQAKVQVASQPQQMTVPPINQSLQSPSPKVVTANVESNGSNDDLPF